MSVLLLFIFCGFNRVLMFIKNHLSFFRVHISQLFYYPGKFQMAKLIFLNANTSIHDIMGLYSNAIAIRWLQHFRDWYFINLCCWIVKFQSRAWRQYTDVEFFSFLFSNLISIFFFVHVCRAYSRATLPE